MENAVFLNYTHGNILQTVCKELIAHGSDPGAQCECLKWLYAERMNLLKRQPEHWNIPVSTNTYYEHLIRIEELLKAKSTSEAYEKLLKDIENITRAIPHILFLTQEPACWPSLESVFHAAQEREDMKATLVFTPFFHSNYTSSIDHYDEYQEKSVPVIRYYEYNLPEDSPDVVFMIKPYGNVPAQYQFHELERAVPRTIYIAYGMEITLDLVKFGFQHYAQYKAWRHCVYGEIVKEYARDYGYRNGENIVVWGHPKADLYRDLERSRKTIPEGWTQFIHGRKVILWTPHHLIDLNSDGTGTWLIWGEIILKIAFDNPDIVFLIRPHPLLQGALINSGVMSERKFEALRRKIDSSPNILWDDTSDYRNAFYASDAIITDGTTFCVEYLYTKRPILLTPRNMKGFYSYEKMLQSYYIGRSEQDFEAFVKMIREGNDPLREKRMRFISELFFIPQSCTVGENIMENVKKDLAAECAKLPYETAEPEQPKRTIPEGSKHDDASSAFPLLSVIVLCYKNTELLHGMLDSIFTQDYPRVQLIVSDDCSDDFDPEQIKTYIDTFGRQYVEDVIVRKNEQNMRTVRHIHDVLELATGDYIIFTAADDRFTDKNVFSSYVESFLNNPDKLWLVARCNMVSPDYKKVQYVTPTPEDKPFFIQGDATLLFSRWARRGMAIPCCMAWKKEAFDEAGGIDLEYNFIEDWPLEAKLLRSGHAPIYLDKITANHSVGGVTNSNDRYGKEIRKQFYEDKYLFFRKEVEPYRSLMTPEDRKCYRQYQREIMSRNYFLNIEWPDTTSGQKARLLMKKPMSIIWVFENWYQKQVKHVNRKKALTVVMAMLLLSLLFQHFGQDVTMGGGFYVILGSFLLVISLLSAIIILLTYPMEKYFLKKQKLRKKLVN